MTTRDQGRRTVRIVTAALTLAGLAGAGGFGAVVYSEIQQGSTTVQAAVPTASATTSTDSSSTDAGDTSGTTGVTSGSGTSVTGSAGS